MKPLIFIFMLVALVPFAFADLNQQVNIYATYSVNGILTDANANLSVLFPSGEVSINNINMSESGTGEFNYLYNCTINGEHTANVIYFNDTDTIGSSSGSFICGNSNAFSFGQCPETTAGLISLWIFYIVLIVICIFGIVGHYPIASVISGIVLIIASLYSWGCGDMITYAMLIFGLVFIIIGANSK